MRWRFGLEFVGRSLPLAKVERSVTENLANADMLSLVNRGYDTYPAANTLNTPKGASARIFDRASSIGGVRNSILRTRLEVFDPAKIAH